jgi:hypothetical protein
MNRKVLPFALLAALPVCLASFGAASQELIPVDEAIQQPALVGEPTPVQVVEIAPARAVTGVPLPPQRSARLTAQRRATVAQARPRVVNRPVAAVQEQPTPQRLALQSKPKSPLFWMTVGVGF